MSVLLYADDILLIAPSVSSANKLLHICEQELTLLDMAINANKNSATAEDGRPSLFTSALRRIFSNR